MKRYCYLMTLVMICMTGYSAMAQYTEDFRAKDILEKRYTDIKGSAYLSDDWLNGTVKLANGDAYRDVPLKFDLVTNELMFMNKEGDARAFADPVAEFMINDGSANRLFRS